MSIFSKFYYEPLAIATCKDIVHPQFDSCWTSALYYLTVPLPSTATFFLPLLILPLMVSKQPLDFELITKTICDYGNAVATSFVVGTSAMCMVCILYNLLGGFTKYTLVAIPTIIGTLNSFFLNEKIAKLFARSEMTVVTEICIRSGANRLLKALRNSTLCRTLGFMTLSATLLDNLRVMNADIFWFTRPSIDKTKLRELDHGENELCSHRGNCKEFNFKEFKSIVKIGCSIGVFQGILSQWNTVLKQPLKLFAAINYKLVLFIIGYPTIFKISNCVLNQNFVHQSTGNNIISGFLAGSVYYIYPELSVFGHAVTCAIETLWQRYISSAMPKPKLIEFINGLPIAKCFILFGMTFLLHIRAFAPYLTPRLLIDIISYATNKKSEEFGTALAAFRMGLHWKNG